MNTTSEDRSRVSHAAQEGDIDGLYRVIEENAHVLEDIDSIPFVDTPLHVAASVGHLRFVTEVMRLKPSFAWKLNPGGLTPIHLALQHGHDNVVLRLVSINKDLVRAKGRKGRTPLHLASKKGEIDLLIKFLLACPNCIKDVTVKSETALHIAVRCGQYEALQVLVGWLKRTSMRGASDLERTTLNWEDEEGNTILHISSRENNLQMVEYLVKTQAVPIRAKNHEGRSALDIATNEEIRSILLVRTGANLLSSNVPWPTFADLLKSKMTFRDGTITYLNRMTRGIKEEERNTYLVVAALVVAATYQFILSPPGGFYQANAGDNNANNTSTNSTATAPQGPQAGTLVLSGSGLDIAFIFNGLSFLSSVILIPFFIQHLVLVYYPILLLMIMSYFCAMTAISQDITLSSINSWVFIFAILFQPIMSIVLIFKDSEIYDRESAAGENRW